MVGYLNKTKEIVKSLEETYKIDVLALAKDYADMKTLETMSATYRCTIHTVLVVLTTLGLRRKRKHRTLDYNIFQAQLLESKGASETIVEEMFDVEEEMNFLRNSLATKDRAVIKLRSEINQLRHEKRSQVKSEHLHDKISLAFNDRIKNYKFSEINTTFNISNAHLQSLPTEGLVVLYGDIHLGEVVTKDEVPNNEYNYDIAKARMDHYIDSIITYPLQSNNVTVVNLQDNIKGMIHNGLYTSEGSFIKSLLEIVDLNVYFYGVLSQVYDVVTVRVTGDNHSRLTQGIPTDNKNIDYARLTDEMTARLLKAKGITNVNICSTEHTLNMFNINGADIVAFHGDSLRSYNVCTGAQRSLLQDHCLAFYNTPYKHAFNGHTHRACLSANQFGGMSITNGTLVGSNAYGTTNGFSSVSSSQTICFVNTKGNIEDTKTINFDSINSLQ